MNRALPHNNPALIAIGDYRLAVVHAPTLSRAGRFVARRYRLEPHVAEIIADLAGLGDREGR